MTKKKTIGIAVIGCGNRSQCVVQNLLNAGKDQIRICSAYDPDPKVIARNFRGWGRPEPAACKSYQEAIAAPGVDWVMVFSPNVNHCEHILAAFKAGKHVFSEKPLATSMEDCQKIARAQQQSGLLFATGFVLRYTELYRTAKEILDSGVLGNIYSINADENIPPEHGGYIMRNWRRFTQYAGPHILEKCCHDLDLINWYCGSVPSRVASFGNRRFFVPENEPLMKKLGKDTFCRWDDPHAAPSPFTSEKDLMDNQCSIAQYRNGINVTFQCTMSNAVPERRMYFTCTYGSMILELYTGILRWRRIGDEFEKSYDFRSDGHGGGDPVIMQELFDTMLHGTEPKCSGREGLESAVFALALDEAARNNSIVDLEPVWEKLSGRKKISRRPRGPASAKCSQ